MMASTGGGPGPMRFRIRAKLILFIGVILAVLVAGLSVVYIQRQRSILQDETRSKIEQMQTDLVTRGRVTTQILSMVLAKLLASYEAELMVAALDSTVKGDPELLGAILQNDRGMVLIHTADRSAQRKVLKGPHDIKARTVKVFTTQQYDSSRGRILEVVQPVLKRTVLPDGKMTNTRWGVLRFQFTLDGVARRAAKAEAALKKKIDQLQLIALMIAAVCLLAGIGAAVYIGRTISDPIERLSVEAHAISEGDLEREIVVQSQDEVGQLARDFEVMRQSIRSLLEKTREQARMESELKTAQAIQSALLPRTVPQLAGFQLGSYYQSASETGGDWFGFIEDSNRDGAFILIGDVTGHGTPSALITATARSTCTTLGRVARRDDRFLMNPGLLLEYLNDEILDSGQRIFCMTFFAGYLDLASRRISYANAGHNKPILIRSNGDSPTVDVLSAAGVRLGDTPGATFDEESTGLEPGDLLFFYTDGLIEGENRAGHQFGKRRLVRVLREARDSSAEAIVQQVTGAANTFFEGVPLKDDITFVVLKVGAAPGLQSPN